MVDPQRHFVKAIGSRPVTNAIQVLLVTLEHRDTLNYLHNRIETLLGRKEAVVIIHGGLGREERRKAEEAFKHDPEVIWDHIEMACGTLFAPLGNTDSGIDTCGIYWDERGGFR